MIRILLLTLFILLLKPSQISSKEPAEQSSSKTTENQLRDSLKLWLISDAHIVGRMATAYVDKLFDAGVGSLQKLKKKIARDVAFLSKLGFDETDAEDITNALSAALIASDANVARQNQNMPSASQENIAIKNYQIEKRHYNISNFRVCSLKFATIGKLNCLVVRIKATALESRALLAILSKEDSNHLVRRIEIGIRIQSSSDDLKVAEVVDEFLTPRPSWMIVSEGIKLVSRQAQASSKQVADRQKAMGERVYAMTLIKQSHALEPQFNMLANIQFPPTQSICAESRLRLGRCVNAGWGSQASNYASLYMFYPWTVFNIWDSYTNTADEGVPYANADLCPDIINKRLCAFLPLTNCTMPGYLTEVSGPEVLTGKYWPVDIVVYSNASVSGSLVPGHDEETLPKGPQNSYQKRLLVKYEPYLVESHRRFAKAPFFVGKAGKRLTTPREALDDPAPRQNSLIYGLVFRLNARYRALVNARILAFRKEQSFPAGTKCVAMHIRRGDRTLESQNMSAYCDNVVVHRNGSCTDRSGNGLSCHKLDELGCFASHPFGALGLQDYLDRAWALLPTHNIFVMTDDPDWLRRQKATVDKAWSISYISGSRENHYSDKATQSGVDFFASIALARRCEAFVGHWGSAVAHLVHRSMCVQHGQVAGQCPPACDIGGAFK